MTNMLDFTKVKRNYFTVVLDDGKNTKLRIPTPSVKLSRTLDYIYLEDQFKTLPSSEQYDLLYDAATSILNHNKENIPLEQKDIQNALDNVMDLWTLLNMYYEFTYTEVMANAKK